MDHFIPYIIYVVVTDQQLYEIVNIPREKKKFEFPPSPLPQPLPFSFIHSPVCSNISFSALDISKGIFLRFVIFLVLRSHRKSVVRMTITRICTSIKTFFWVKGIIQVYRVMGWFGLGSILKMIQANFKKRNCRNCLSLHVSYPEYLRGEKKNMKYISYLEI